MPTSVPSPTRTVLICHPPQTVANWFTTSEIVDDHLQAHATPVMRYRARTSRWWQFLLRARKNKELVNPSPYAGSQWCSGGPKGLLDIEATMVFAANAARARYKFWARDIERRTDRAKPWSFFLAQHEADRQKVSRDEARRRFESQDRVIAMLSANGPYPYDPYELEIYQAGEEAYVAYCWRSALAGDTLITADGNVVKPRTDSVADKLRYLSQACQYLYDLPDQNSVCMVKLA